MKTFILTMQDIFSTKDPNFNNIFSEKGSNAFHFVNFTNGSSDSFIQFISFLVKSFYVIMIGLFFWGMLLLIWSKLGNSGETKKKGVDTVLSVYVLIMLVTVGLIAFCSMSHLAYGQAKAFAAMLLGEVVFMAGSIVLYAYATFDKMLYLMTGEEKKKRDSVSTFNHMAWVAAGSGLIALLAEVI